MQLSFVDAPTLVQARRTEFSGEAQAALAPGHTSVDLTIADVVR
jgi:hypothetical protein